MGLNIFKKSVKITINVNFNLSIINTPSDIHFLVLWNLTSC